MSSPCFTKQLLDLQHSNVQCEIRLQSFCNLNQLQECKCVSNVFWIILCYFRLWYYTHWLTFLLGDKSEILCVPTPISVPAISIQFRLPFLSIASTKILTCMKWCICGVFRSFTLYLNMWIVKSSKTIFYIPYYRDNGDAYDADDENDQELICFRVKKWQLHVCKSVLVQVAGG